MFVDVEEKVREFWKKYPELKLSRETVRILCPPCADKMEKQGISALIIKQGQLPQEAVAGLCDSLGAAEGFFDRCMGHDFGEFHPDDKEAFCAWLHNECLGKFPSQSEALADYDKWLRDADLEALESYRKGSGPAPFLYKQNGALAKVESSDTPFLFVASEETEDRLGDVIATAGWQLENYKRNPVFLFVHDQSIPPIGIVPKIWPDGKQLLAHVRFDEDDEFARLVKGKYQRKFMRAVSVGFKALEFEERDLDVATPGRGTGLLFKKQELVELSAVPVPAHPAALQRMMGARPTWSLPSDSYLKRLERLEAFLPPTIEKPLALPDLAAIGHRIWET